MVECLKIHWHVELAAFNKVGRKIELLTKFFHFVDEFGVFVLYSLTRIIRTNYY